MAINVHWKPFKASMAIWWTIHGPNAELEGGGRGTRNVDSTHFSYYISYWHTSLIAYYLKWVNNNYVIYWFVDCSWFMAQGSCLKAHGSRLVAHGHENNVARGPVAGALRQVFLGHEPWALSHGLWGMSHEPWAFSHEPLVVAQLTD